MTADSVLDVLVVGGGPAALAISAALGERNLEVGVLSSGDRRQRWANTYGIWGQEVDDLDLQHLLAHRWSETVSHFDDGADGCGDESPHTIRHRRDYGLFDKQRLQEHWLTRCDRHGVRWWCDAARRISHSPDLSTVSTESGASLRARLVVDASGHDPVFVRKPHQPATAGQAAYGVVARFSQPPIRPGRFVFMDYRCAHLTEEQRLEPPTFLYAMHLGDDLYFVEETSLALSPAVPFAVLKQRLRQRLDHCGAVLDEILHEEFCLFPMNPPLPERPQRVVGFGGAAGMVHPASGFMVGSLLRRAPALAEAITQGMNESTSSGESLARQAWQALWPADLRLKREFYRFGLQKLMGFDEQRLRHHFHAFFQLPDQLWYGFLTNSLSLGDLALAMAHLFALAPWDVRAGLLLPAQPAPDWRPQTLMNDNQAKRC